MLHTKENLHLLEVNVSEILESYGIPDPYIWRINEFGKIIPEKDDTPIENIIFKNNHIARLEFDAFLKIQEHAKSMSDGDYCLWISPIHPVYYPDTSKIIITVKEEGKLVNKSINTNWDAFSSILIARELATLSDLDPFVFKSTNDVRANPIFINADKEEHLGLAIKKILNPKVIEMIEKGEDWRLKEKFMGELRQLRQVAIGQLPRSCPELMSAFGVFAGRDEYGSLQFECPHCHRINKREPHKLLEKCQHCKEDVRCK